MPIGVRCAECGREYHADDSLAGAELRCRDCGHMIPVPGSPPGEKICIVCGKDVFLEERVRDPQGNYYCQPCWNASLIAYQALPRKVQSTQSMATLSATAVIRAQGARRKSELVKLVTTFVNTRRSWKFTLGVWLLILVGFIAGWFIYKVAVTLASALVVAGVCMVVFYLLWEVGLPFRNGFGDGWACLIHPARRRQWMEYNRDFRLRRPGRILLIGLAMILLAAAAFSMAARRADLDAMGRGAASKRARMSPAASQPVVEPKTTQQEAEGNRLPSAG